MKVRLTGASSRFIGALGPTKDAPDRAHPGQLLVRGERAMPLRLLLAAVRGGLLSRHCLPPKTLLGERIDRVAGEQ